MMRRCSTLAFTACLAVFGLGCPEHGHDAEHDAEDDAEHDHGPGGDHAPHGPAAPERPTLDVTVYESGLELFMEYPAFVVGTDSPLVAHLTDARDAEGFVAIKEGRLTATLTFDGGPEGGERFVADAPQRLGVFKPVVRPTKAGKATLTLRLEGQQQTGVVRVGEVVVHPDLAAAMAAEAPEAAGAEQAFPYLKEAMWKTVYATDVAAPRVLRGGIAATGEVKPVAGQAAELSSPAAAMSLAAAPRPTSGRS